MDLKDVTCYKCNKKGHFAKECPQGTDDRKQVKKAYIATWSDDEDEDPESWALPDMCGMAIGETTGEQPSEVAVRGNNAWFIDSGCSNHMT